MSTEEVKVEREKRKNQSICVLRYLGVTHPLLGFNTYTCAPAFRLESIASRIKEIGQERLCS